MSDDRETIAFAERVLAVLELGSFSATYKYALFTAILDLCLESVSATGAPPTSLTTRQLATKVVELYWPHAAPYEGRTVLRQGGGRTEQAEILRSVQRFRSSPAVGGEVSPRRARERDPEGFGRLVDAVEWKLVEMPIPKLQRVGGSEDRFLYEYTWGEGVRASDVAAARRGEKVGFDNQVRLRPGVAEMLLRLNGILRPLVRREWAAMVASMNGLAESRLEEFLFGAPRASLEPVRGPLRELQSGRCFYCDGAVHSASEVDHFIPWSRYPDNGLENLVLTHARCNAAKREVLAAAEHVERWAGRNARHAGELAAIAAAVAWEREPHRTAAVARATYLRLPDGVRLWLAGSELVPLDRERLSRALLCTA